jgi:hypothetical protein
MHYKNEINFITLTQFNITLNFLLCEKVIIYL